MIPRHYNSENAGKILKWSGTDNKETFNNNYSDPANRDFLNSYLDIEYNYNSHGFRTDEFDCRPAGLAFGCSYTEGVGLRYNETWPALLANKLSMHLWNLGVGGASSGTIYRLLSYYLNDKKLDLTIKFVAINIPPKSRFEYFDGIIDDFAVVSPGNINDFVYFKNDNFLKHWFLNDINSDLDEEKSLLAIQFLCVTHNLPLVITYSTDDKYCKNVSKHKARDLQHHGFDYQLNIANDMYQQLCALGPL